MKNDQRYKCGIARDAGCDAEYIYIYCDAIDCTAQEDFFFVHLLSKRKGRSFADIVRACTGDGRHWLDA